MRGTIMLVTVAVSVFIHTGMYPALELTPRKTVSRVGMFTEELPTFRIRTWTVAPLHA